MKIKMERATIVFNIMGYVLIAILTVLCLLPFLLIVSGSFTPEIQIISKGFSLIPETFSLDAYKAAFSNPKQILDGYKVTIFITVAGTAVGLFLTSMAGFVLSRKDFKYRDQLSFFIYFTTLFSGGLIPWYILITKHLDLKDTYMALIVPSLLSAWNIILMKNFMKSIPDSIVESAKIDGAGEFTIYLKLILPLSGPGLATIGLFMALGYWNDWFMANLFITSESHYPLQFLLYKILASAAVLKTNVAGNLSPTFQPPAETLKMAAAVIATGPIVFLYPFVQRFFVKGLTIGAVKG
ncbi:MULTISPECIES: carbohydrate ABC transporter permease [unclassified Paenibacillus]|uniref:carbohydrate ABC transporter permease n=1 Tax=unclassified Paenibacillus TaxID=185978 RepID=UPI001048CC1F|nr:MULTISPECIES: carbohydrate ABC transporter permease [unclassified Paenibacillus]NIK69301.1 putative aldouronate transport system permease protein [Paenibacillus sp. BK720]TCM92743.1 putative aldouronate transport system permease protein [Paenibacillus sp. BK033]